MKARYHGHGSRAFTVASSVRQPNYQWVGAWDIDGPLAGGMMFMYVVVDCRAQTAGGRPSTLFGR